MRVSEYYASDWMGVEWTEWGPLDIGKDFFTQFSTEEGQYRFRHRRTSGLEDVGGTGRSVRGRVGLLAQGTYADEMAYHLPGYSVSNSI